MAKSSPDLDPRAIAQLWAPIQAYDWGSREFIARLQGRPVPSAGPEAELWIGDHPRAPSILGPQASAVSLSDHIRQNPSDTLGVECLRNFGPRLPFLAKVLAAARPLSLQVHPDRGQAETGFEEEESKHISLSAPERTYSDANRKIELMIAMEPFSALSGFRSSDSLDQILERANLPTLAQLRPTGVRPEHAAGRIFFGLRSMTASHRSLLLTELHAYAERFAAQIVEARWVESLIDAFPGDVGAAAPLLLNLVELDAGQGLFVRPGILHSYLRGNGFEVMSSSDNVVRGGLTSKHVNQSALEKIAQLEAAPPDVVIPKTTAPGVLEYDLRDRGVDEYRVSVLSIGPDEDIESLTRTCAEKPAVLLCIEGAAELHSPRADSTDTAIDVSAGQAVWIPASHDGLDIRLRKPSDKVRLFEVRVP